MYFLPKPQEIKIEKGNQPFFLKYDTAITIEDSCPEQAFAWGKLLQEEIRRAAGLSLLIRKGEGREGEIVLSAGARMKEEEYTLEIKKEGILVQGGSYRGILYGVQTLRQIFRQEGGALSALYIHDYPEFPVRGYYHDVTRGRVPKLSWLKRLADTMSFYKLNQLQLYIEHTYLFRDFSEVWRDDTPLTAEDILELDCYCRKLGIDLVPSLSSFGHLYKLLRTKQYRHLGELKETADEPFGLISRLEHHTINPTLDESFELIKKMILEYMSLFRSDYFNICADETFDLGKGACRQEAEEKGVDRLYMDFVKKLCEFVVSQGKTPMFWGDIICGFPEMIGELPKGTICLNWGYAWNQSEDSTRKIAQTGAVQYVCPGVCGWNQYINRLDYAYQNISRMCSYGVKYKAAGVLNTDWGDYGHINHPSLSIPGLIYGAAFSWNKEEIPYEEINKEISLIQYGDTSERFTGITAEIARKTVYDWWTMVMRKERGDQEACRKTEEQKAEAAGNDREIEALLEELGQCGRFLAPDCREELLPVYLGAEAVRIFNKTGLAVSGKEYEAQELSELACRLEKWFCHYRMLWEKVSRESELRRIGDVVFWYCDLLRDMADKAEQRQK